MKNNIKDNPVPSLEDLANKFFEINKTNKSIKKICIDFAKFVLSENGGETNREQPKEDISYFSRYKD